MMLTVDPFSIIITAFCHDIKYESFVDTHTLRVTNEVEHHLLGIRMVSIRTPDRNVNRVDREGDLHAKRDLA